MAQEYLTRYPKTISFHDGIKRTISIDAKGVEQLTVIVKKNVDDLLKLFKNEGFTHVKFEHKQESQIGHGLSLKLKKPWEMHVRLVDMKKGLSRNTCRSRGLKGLFAALVLPENPSDL